MTWYFLQNSFLDNQSIIKDKLREYGEKVAFTPTNTVLKNDFGLCVISSLNYNNRDQETNPSGTENTAYVDEALRK